MRFHRRRAGWAASARMLAWSACREHKLNTYIEKDVTAGALGDGIVGQGAVVGAVYDWMRVWGKVYTMRT